jgi:hypothetical protein
LRAIVLAVGDQAFPDAVGLQSHDVSSLIHPSDIATLGALCGSPVTDMSPRCV